MSGWISKKDRPINMDEYVKNDDFSTDCDFYNFFVKIKSVDENGHSIVTIHLAGVSFFDDGRVARLFVDSFDDECGVYSRCERFDYTHWMPLPEPPRDLK